MQTFRFLLYLMIFVTPASLYAQSWLWGGRGVPFSVAGAPFETHYAFPVNTMLDDRGNVYTLSYGGDIYLSKHDPLGNQVWAKVIKSPAPPNSNWTDTTVGAISSICVDGGGNIYFTSRPITAIGGNSVNITGPYALTKLNPNGNWVWSRTIDYTPAVLNPVQIACSGDKIFFSIPYAAFTTLNISGQSFSNLTSSNAINVLIGAVDTAHGQLQWGRRVYSPAFPITCSSYFDVVSLTVNAKNEMLLTGHGTGRLYEENTVLLDTPGCSSFLYMLSLDGNTGKSRWARRFYSDTVTTGPNTTQLSDFLSCILSNGYSVVYSETRQDTILRQVPFMDMVLQMSNKLYLYDTGGNLIRQTSLGTIRDGYPIIHCLQAGEDATLFTAGDFYGYSPGRIGSTDLPDIAKWDTTLIRRWEKGLDYNFYFPEISVSGMSYRNHALTVLASAAYADGDYGNAFFGKDSLPMSYIDFMAKMTDSANFISGTVFFDLNKNGILDNNERPAPGVLIGSTKGDTVYTISQRDGYYQFLAPPGSYTFKPLHPEVPYPYFSQPSPASAATTIAGYGNFIRNKSFALQSQASVTDGAISITPYTHISPGRLLHLKLAATNVGTTTLGGSYTLSFDTTKLTFLGSTDAITTRPDGSLYFALPSLLPFDNHTSDLDLRTHINVHAGDTIQLIARLTTQPGDAAAGNNTDTLHLIARSSFDPNDKTVSPFNDVDYDSVTASRQELDYLIRFQNTGTDTAYTVQISDSLDSRLDATTFRMINTSHPVDIGWSAPRTLQFIFRNIQLPDSNTNGTGSHGFVRFRIKPYSTVGLDDKINNTAAIYFDYNDPVQTNQVISTFGIRKATPPPSNSGPGSSDTTGRLRLFPNPTTGALYFTLDQEEPAGNLVVNVYDAWGRLVQSQSKAWVPGTTGSLNMTGLSRGTYYLEIWSSTRQYVMKFLRF